MYTYNQFEKTDPEYMEIFKEFTQRDSLPASGLDEKTAALAILAVNVGLDSITNFNAAVNQALDAGLTPVQIREAVYQTTPMVGFAKAFGFVEVMNSVFEQKGIELPLENEATVSQNEAMEKGLALMEELFGQYIAKLSQGEKELGDSTDFDHWLIKYGFGEFATRGGLDIKQREMVTFCSLYSMGGAQKETRTHVRVNMNIGNDKDFLVSVLKACTPYVGFPKTFNALNIINSVAEERQELKKAS